MARNKTAHERAKAFLERMYDHIKHGDDAHRAWLKAEVMAYEVALAKELEDHVLDSTGAINDNPPWG